MHLYNAVNDQVLTLDEATAGVKVALWDSADPNLFMLSDADKTLSLYIYMPTSLDGPSMLAAPSSTHHLSCHVCIYILCFGRGELDALMHRKVALQKALA